jgi:DNA-binding transcriptional LysR family regulator
MALAPEDRARRRLDAILRAAGVMSKIIDETRSSATLCALALNGAGIGITNPTAAEGFPLRGVEFRPFETTVYFRSVLLFRPGGRKARLIKSFMAELMRVRSAEAR